MQKIYYIITAILGITFANAQIIPRYYQITNLGYLSDEHQASWGVALNDSLEVTGQSMNDYVQIGGLLVSSNHGFYWRDNEMIDIGSFAEAQGASHVNDINNDGVVVGFSCEMAFKWEDGQLTQLNGPLGYPVGTAYGINDSGLIVGSLWFWYGYRAVV